MYIHHRRVEITVTKYQKACPYCKKKPLIKKTCGSYTCQYKHHILDMRSYPRKTERRHPTRTVSTSSLS